MSDDISKIQIKKTLRVSEIEPNRLQPRKAFDEAAIISLAESIREHGVIQPLLVRPYNGIYQIVAGERRWRASMMAGIQEVPVIIKELDDKETMQLALIENLQREDLNPIEKAAGLKELAEKYNMTQESLATIVGRSRSSVANSLRLLNLPSEIQELVKNGLVSEGHAKVLLGIEDIELMKQLAEKVSEEQISVRSLESIVSNLISSSKRKSAEKKSDSYYKEMELSLNECLGRKVSVKHNSKNKGTLVLEFYDKADLLFLADKLSK